MEHVFWNIGHKLILPKIIKGEGCYLYDDKNQKYVDMESGVWCTIPIFSLTIYKIIVKFIFFIETLEIEMEIKLGTLHDGINEINLEASAGELGLEKDEEMAQSFPEKISAGIEVQKLSDRYYVKTKLFTTAYFLCDRCLENFNQNLKCSFRLYYLKSVEEKADESNYRFLPGNAHEIDLTEDVKENLLLAVPMKKLCKESCKGLCTNCGANLNKKKCSCKQEKIDPRWEKLSRIL